jgi:hypothetical protein
MKKGIILTAMMIAILAYLLPSCYKNNEDILTLPVVSFRGEIVPIVIAGGCGCHNNGVYKNAVQFSHKDTIFYDGILARDSILNAMATVGTHPGGGEIYFKPNEAELVAKWFAEGSNDDGGGCTVTGTVTYTNDILPIYNTSCKGGSCHGGIAITLDYNYMVTNVSKLSSMCSTGGESHPGGPLSMGTCTIKTFEAWIAQGQPK